MSISLVKIFLSVWLALLVVLWGSTQLSCSKMTLTLPLLLILQPELLVQATGLVFWTTWSLSLSRLFVAEQISMPVFPIVNTHKAASFSTGLHKAAPLCIAFLESSEQRCSFASTFSFRGDISCDIGFLFDSCQINPKVLRVSHIFSSINLTGGRIIVYVSQGKGTISDELLSFLHSSSTCPNLLPSLP